MTIKFSEEQLKKWGVATQEDIVAALEKANQPPVLPPPAPEAKTEPVSVSAELLGRLTAVEATVKTLSPESILASVATEAKRVASLEVSAAIARSGGAALQQKSDPAEPPAGKAAVDPNDFAAQYDATPAIRAEFLSKTSYVKFCEARRDGRIRSHDTVNQN